MGGCRCTYRNCNVKSDGKTHMFHFPVFDKVRCHQWLVNAHRLDFLDLKVSQLKNRCICQHHFKTENFMNYKRDKLTFDAVPTLNGPFCDPSKAGTGDNKKYPNPILVEDIENDFDINDKKSNFALKYGDFLTNNEFVDSSARYNRSNISQIKDKISTEPQNIRLELPIKKMKKLTSHLMMVVPPYSDLSNELKLGRELNLEQNFTNLQSNVNVQDQNSKPEVIISSTQLVNNAPKYNQILSEELKIGNEINLEQNVTNPLANLNLQDQNCIPENRCVLPPVELIDTVSKSNQPFVKKGSKIKILSETKIKEPINIGHLTGKFEKISPSCHLTLPDKSMIKQENKPKIIPDTLIVESEIKPSEKLRVLDVLNVEFGDLVTKKTELTQCDQNKAPMDKIHNIEPQSSPKKSTPTKNKVTPERSAAIEKKRKFNMKLKDIIESCLDKLDDPVKNYEISPNLINKLEKSSNTSVKKPLEKRKIKQNAEKVVTHLVDDKKLPSVQDYTIAYLEERMNKMESTLLSKIAQNSQQIIDFKNTMTIDPSQVCKKRKERSTKRVVSTQTNENETGYKKFLYQEISKYLSESSNSIIYEELFINKYTCDNVDNPSKRKRRRCI